jgi:CO/xanthine dehydrogenase FAD-binding subunit
MLGYRNAPSLGDAVAALTDLPTWKPVAGGTDVLVQLQADRNRAEGYVNLWGLLPRHIEEVDGEIRIGAGVTCTDVERSPMARQLLPPLWEASRTMGSPQVRNRATLGGNIGNASPAADMAAALLVDGARALIRNAGGDRAESLGQVLVGPGVTTLEPGDVLVELLVPKPEAHSFTRFDKLGFRQAQVISAVSFSMRASGSAGAIDDLRICWGSVAPTPVRAPAVEGILRGATLSDRLIEDAVDAAPADIAPIDDHRASAIYRTAVARSFLRRALLECQQWLST